ncbi:hypothetical protein JCM10908_001409 [Rhodotorula pacifica]|uniref:ribonuclease Z n=1 Tax=Rhodotorula pacifica TaxID=1495444 RepID=UPI00316C1149
MPIDSISVTFLGTAAGRPCTTRNVSSLVLKLDSKLWMVDAGEGTQHRLIESDKHCKTKLAMSKIRRIFITHMHADHVNGLPGLLATISAGDGIPQASTSTGPQPTEPLPIEIYGPSGLRQFLRVSLSLTQTILSRPYTVHELLFPDETPYDDNAKLHPSERTGRDVRPDGEGFWREVVTAEEGGGVSVSAGPIQHTIRCLGYLFSESPRSLPIQPSLYIPHLRAPLNAAGLLASHGLKNPLSLLSLLQTNPEEEVVLADGTVLRAPGLDTKNGGRRVVVLGDTYDASGMVPLIRARLDSGTPSSTLVGSSVDDPMRVDLVVHESTNAYLPTLDDSQSPLKLNPVSGGDSSRLHTLSSVTSLARSHGHSTPQVAGSFARSVKASRLVLNHLSVKYPDPEARADTRGDGEGSAESREKWRRMLREIERQAEQALEGVEETDADLLARASLSVEETGREEEAEAQGRRVVAARDFMEIEIPRRDRVAGQKRK